MSSSPKSCVWLGNQTSVLDGPWPADRLGLPEASEPNKDGSGFRDRQKKVKAHRSRRERSITPTEDGESGSLFTWKRGRDKGLQRSSLSFIWQQLTWKTKSVLPDHDPLRGCLVQSPHSKERTGEGNWNQSLTLEVTSSLFPVWAQHLQTASLALRQRERN